MSVMEVLTFHHDGLDRDIPILGICGSPIPLDRAKIYFEKTEGRRNIVTIQESQPGQEGITTLWTAVGTRCWCSRSNHSGVQKCLPSFCFTAGLKYNLPKSIS